MTVWGPVGKSQLLLIEGKKKAGRSLPFENRM